MFINKYSSELIAGFISLVVGYFLHKATSQRPKVVSYLSNVSEFVVQSTPPAPNIPIHTHSITIQNIGNSTAHKIIVGHLINIQNFRVFPNIPFTNEVTPQGAWVLRFESLAPRQFITISYLYFPPVTFHSINQFVRFDEGEAKIIQVAPFQVRPKVWIWTYNFLAFVGLLTFIFGAYKVLMFLWQFFKRS